MANTFTQLYIHAIIVVENRQCVLKKSFRDEVFKYITGIVNNRGHKLLIINGSYDHIHILISLNPVDSISELLKEVKRSSTNYINSNSLIAGKFSLQPGYAAFSYSKSSLQNVIKYIENQEEHHRLRPFSDEYIELLKKFEIDYDDKFIFKTIENIED